MPIVASEAAAAGSISGISPFAGNVAAGPGPGNGSEQDAPDPNRLAAARAPAPRAPAAAWPGWTTPDDLRRARLRDRAAEEIPAVYSVAGGRTAAAVPVGEGCYDLHYDAPDLSLVVRSVPGHLVQEAAPPSDEAERWILDNKAEFKRRYGASWRSYLYGRAWRIFGDRAKKRDGSHAEAHREGALWAFSAFGESPSSRAASLRAVHEAVAAAGGVTVLREGSVLEAAQGPEARGRAKPKTAWQQRRPLTDAEKEKLRVPHGEIQASVSHVPGHGYVVHTHRARSSFYKTPGSIPASSIRFISSTS